MTVLVQLDDLSSAEVQALVAEHVAGMHAYSPSCSVHALALEGLRAANVSFFTAWVDDVLAGCGALKAMDAHTGEIKSMRTRDAFLRRGVGQAVLDMIETTARARGYTRLVLETGTGPAFEAAHALYRRNGYVGCARFGEYVQTDFNVFFEKRLIA